MGSIFIKNKHLSSATGNYAKFATTEISTAQGWVQQALRSPNARFLPNPQIPNTFQVVTDLGTKIGIQSNKALTVYNFTVEGYHTYYVSESNVLVHNGDPCDVELKFKYHRNGQIKDGPEFAELKDHAKRHGDGNAVKYYNSAVINTKQATWKFKVRHEGQNKIAYVTQQKNGKYLFTSTSLDGKRIFTHMEVDAQYLKNKGITLPKK